MKNTLSTLVVSAVIVAQASAHGDTIHLYYSGGVPSVGSMSDIDGSVTPQRAFLTNWNWIVSQNAFSTSDPGWNWDGAFLETDSLKFRVLTSLQKWNGFEFVDSEFNARIRLGTDSVTTVEGVTEGFSSVIGANDHFHYRYNLDGVAQSDSAAIGVYRLNFEGIRTSGTSTINYPSFGLVLNRGADAITANAAFAYANANPVPEPASLTALALGAAALLRKKRNR